jgi:hypothetical protein
MQISHVHRVVLHSTATIILETVIFQMSIIMKNLCTIGSGPGLAVRSAALILFLQLKITNVE